MKNFIFLFIGFFCFAHSQTDSVKIVQQLQKLEQVNNETKILLKKSDKIDKENRTLIFKIKKYIERITRSEDAQNVLAENYSNKNGVLPSNINEPILEIDKPDGQDSIRGSFFYRLFHKEIYIIKPYKIINNEKVYLD